MLPKVFNINEIYEVENYSNSFSKKKLEKSNRKTINLYRKIISKKYSKYEIICDPFGYSMIIFGNQIILPFKSIHSDHSKLEKRNRYNLKHVYKKDSNNSFMEEPIYSLKREDDYIYYSKSFFLYESKSSLLHDVHNSINFFLDIKLESSSYISKESLRGFVDLNVIINNIKNYKRDFITNFSYNHNYQTKFELLKELFQSFNESVHYYYNDTDTIDINKLTKEELNLVSGYGLFNTLAEYHSGVLNGLPYNIGNIKPHKLINKLKKMLEVKAGKRGLKIKITTKSNISQKNIRNYSDIYIAFFSIIENAIKYSIPNETIVIDIVDYQELVKVTISNKSNYISQTEIENLSNNKFKGSNSKGSSSSSGMGLYLVKEIFEKSNIEFEITFINEIFTVVVNLKDLK